MKFENRIKMIYSAFERKIEAAWIICGSRLVQIQDASIEDVVNYFEIGAVQYLC
jgi:hypothetical protein